MMAAGRFCKWWQLLVARELLAFWSCGQGLENTIIADETSLYVYVYYICVLGGREPEINK